MEYGVYARARERLRELERKRERNKAWRRVGSGKRKVTAVSIITLA